MLSPMLVWLSLAGQLATCAWVPGREMQVAMWRARWSGVSHYGKLPLNYLSTQDPFEFIDKDVPLENWQQACIHRNDKMISQWNSTRREWKGVGIERDAVKERPWVDPSCDAYSLGLIGECGISWYGPTRRKAREADYVIIGDTQCFFGGPFTERKARGDSSERFHPTGASKTSINPQLIHRMYKCPSTRPLALWVCPKCSSTSMGNWLLRIDNPTLIKRVSQVMNEVIASWPYDEGRAASMAMEKGILDDFPGSVTSEELARIGFKTVVKYDVVEDKGNRTNIDVSVWMPRSYCTLCCAWGDGRLRIVVARNPFVRLMSYYKMKMIDEADDTGLFATPLYEGWSDFRPWILALLSHRERTGRFTSESAHQFTDQYLGCEQREKTHTCGNSSGDSMARTPCHAMECAYRNPIITWQDVLHAMPVVDTMFAAGYEAHVREEGSFHVMHLESIEKDTKDVEERLCREYDDCEPLPEYPHIYPRRGNNDKCRFNAKTRTFSNCTVTWEQLWPPSLVDLVNMHYAEDFRLLGYKTTPFDVMPI